MGRWCSGRPADGAAWPTPCAIQECGAGVKLRAVRRQSLGGSCPMRLGSPTVSQIVAHQADAAEQAARIVVQHLQQMAGDAAHDGFVQRHRPDLRQQRRSASAVAVRPAGRQSLRTRCGERGGWRGADAAFSADVRSAGHSAPPVRYAQSIPAGSLAAMLYGPVVCGAWVQVRHPVPQRRLRVHVQRRPGPVCAKGLRVAADVPCRNQAVRRTGRVDSGIGPPVPTQGLAAQNGKPGFRCGYTIISLVAVSLAPG
jgi:hypothetical protein